MLDTNLLNPTLPLLLTGEELAAVMRYTGVTSAFRASLKALGIKPVPGRNDIYDPHHVRHRLDLAHGILRSAPGALGAQGAAAKPLSKTEERRQRRGQI